MDVAVSRLRQKTPSYNMIDDCHVSPYFATIKKDAADNTKMTYIRLLIVSKFQDDNFFTSIDRHM